MQIRKICIKSIAVLMAAIVMVSTPLSRFADTKGVSETHAVAPAVITLGGLFGAIAGAYGLYVGLDKLADYVSGWEIWTSTNNEDAYSDLQTIKNGVTSYVITKAVTSSVADFLASKVSDDYSYISQGVADTHTQLDQSRLDSIYHKDFEYLYANDGYPRSSEYIPVFYYWTATPSSKYNLDGEYTIFAFGRSEVENICNTDGVVDVVYYTVKNPSTGALSLICSGFDSSGAYVAHTDRVAKYNTILHKQNGWSSNSSSGLSSTLSDSARLISSDLIAKPHSYFLPVYETDFPTFNSARTLEEIKTNSYATKSITVDYKTHGNNALDNTNALEGAEVTQAQLEVIQQAVEKEYSNVVQFPNSGGDNEEEPDTQALANAITLAVLSTLQNMGYIKNPTDEPSGENVKEQLGNIQISLDGLIDAISQINPAQGLANIAQGIAELPQKITVSVTDAIRNVFEDLFVPDEGAIQDKVDEITDKFAFADSLLTVVDDIDGALKNASGPPEIYIHFEDAEDSKYTPIGTLKLLSFEWYERYKPYGDALLSSMLWLFFLWKVRKRIAEIVQGLSVSGESDANASANSAIGIERGRSS